MVRGTAEHVDLPGQKTDALADASYQGAHKRPGAKDDVQWHVAMRKILRSGQKRGVMRTMKAMIKLDAPLSRPSDT